MKNASPQLRGLYLIKLTELPSVIPGKKPRCGVRHNCEPGLFKGGLWAEVALKEWGLMIDLS
ncbi:MAG: hypothetical protein QXM43_05060 [Desulfurococcaceae archaeon]